MRSWYLYALLLLACIGCSGASEIVLEGTVEDGITAEAVEGVMIDAAYSSINNGTFNAGGAPVASAVSDANGQFSLRFEPKNVVNYQLKGVKEGYFQIDSVYDKSEWLVGETTVLQLRMLRQCSLHIRMINNTDPSARMLFQLPPASQSCPTCCTSELVALEGLVDTSWTCIVVCPQELEYSFEIVKDGDINDRSGWISIGHGSDTLVVKL